MNLQELLKDYNAKNVIVESDTSWAGDPYSVACCLANEIVSYYKNESLDNLIEGLQQETTESTIYAINELLELDKTDKDILVRVEFNDSTIDYIINVYELNEEEQR